MTVTEEAAKTWPTILIVDDEPDIRESLRDLLKWKLASVNVLLAASGDEAWFLVDHNRVDVVLVDYRLGRDDGLDLLHSLRSKHPDLRALLMTAYPNAHAFAKAVNWGLVEGILIKPFRDDALLAAVKNLIQRRGGSRRGIPASRRNPTKLRVHRRPEPASMPNDERRSER